MSKRNKQTVLGHSVALTNQREARKRCSCCSWELLIFSTKITSNPAEKSWFEGWKIPPKFPFFSLCFNIKLYQIQQEYYITAPMEMQC